MERGRQWIADREERLHPTLDFDGCAEAAKERERQEVARVVSSSENDFYVMTWDGALHKIGHLPRYSWNLTELDNTWGYLKMGSHDNNWFYIEFTPTSQGISGVKAFQIEGDTYYHEDNFFESDYDITISYRYLRDLTMDFSPAREAIVKWTLPTKVKVEANNEWLPQQIGVGVSNYQYTNRYQVKKSTSNEATSTKLLDVNAHSSGSVEMDDPLDKDFTIEVIRNTRTSFTFDVKTVSQNYYENGRQLLQFSNPKPQLSTTFNQVKGEMTIMWPDPGERVRKEGDYQVYRTLLTGENGNYAGNRELIGTTAQNHFIDNTTRNMEYGKTYRYEVFQLKDSWAPITIPTNPEQALNMVNSSEVVASTVPIIPMHLIRDNSITDKIKFDWDFGNIPNVENDLTFKVHRIEPGGDITRNYLTVTVPRSAGKASFVDEKPQSMCDIYGYYVQLDLLDNKVHLYSDTVQAHLLEGTEITGMEASKGVNGNSVKIDWTAHQVGIAKTTFTIMRRLIGADDWIKVGQVSGTEDSYSSRPAGEPVGS